MDFPFWIAQAEAPDPKCNAIIDVLSTGYMSMSEILEVDLLKIRGDCFDDIGIT